MRPDPWASPARKPRTCWSSTRRPSIRATPAAARSIRSTSSTGRRSSRLIGEDGRAPEPPDPAYQQILHGRAGRRLLGRRAPLPAAQRARAQALRHEPGRADRAHRQHRAAARRGDARLLPRRLDARRLRHPAQGMDGRPDPLVPGLFRRADERQSGAPAA